VLIPFRCRLFNNIVHRVYIWNDAGADHPSSESLYVDLKASQTPIARRHHCLARRQEIDSCQGGLSSVANPQLFEVQMTLGTSMEGL